MVWLHPCCSLRIGETAVTGDVFILPVSGRTVRLPLTRTSQLSPPVTRPIHALPVYLYKCNRQVYTYVLILSLASSPYCEIGVGHETNTYYTYMQLVHLRSLKIIHATDVICIGSLSTWPVFIHTKVSALELHTSYHSSATWLTDQIIICSKQPSRSNSTCITEKTNGIKIITPPPGNSVSDDDLKHGRGTSCILCTFCSQHQRSYCY